MKYLITTLILVSTAIGCKKFVEVPLPKSRVAGDVVFSSDITATAAMLGVYINLMDWNGFASSTNVSVTAFGGLSADELFNYPANPDDVAFEQNKLLSNNPRLTSFWNSPYKSIFEANAVLKGLASNTGVTPALVTQLEGEALFVRAFAHFYLVNFFGDVPVIITTDYNVNKLVTRDSVSKVYEQIIADLLEAQSKMSDEYPSPERARPNRTAATALLARTYLYRKEWAKAAAEATKIIGDADYALPDSLDDVFIPSSTEIIWQLRPAITGTLGYPAEAYYTEPTMAMTYNVLDTILVASFEPGDFRRRKWVRSYDSGIDTIYSSHKYKQEMHLSAPLTEYSVVLRAAEQYFIRAEARAQLNDIEGAQDDLNAIRHRAGLGDTPANDKASLLLAIEKEKRFEYMWEWGHRWLDLKRWGRAVAVLSAKPNGFTANDERYPLPAIEMIKNPQLKPQNPGY